MKKISEILKSKRTRIIGILIIVIAIITGGVICHKNFINSESTDQEIYIHQNIERLTCGLILCDHCEIYKDSDSLEITTDIDYNKTYPRSYWENGILLSRGYEEK